MNERLCKELCPTQVEKWTIYKVLHVVHFPFSVGRPLDFLSLCFVLINTHTCTDTQTTKRKVILLSLSHMKCEHRPVALRDVLFML